MKSRNRGVVKKGLILLFQISKPTKFWPYSFRISIFMLNIFTCSTLDFKILISINNPYHIATLNVAFSIPLVLTSPLHFLSTSKSESLVYSSPSSSFQHVIQHTPTITNIIPLNLISFVHHNAEEFYSF